MSQHDRPIEEGAPGVAIVMQQIPALMNALERALLDAYLAGVDWQKQQSEGAPTPTGDARYEAERARNG